LDADNCPCKEEADKPCADDLEKEQEEEEEGTPVIQCFSKKACLKPPQRIYICCNWAGSPKAGKLDKYMSCQEFKTIMSAPWERKSTLGTLDPSVMLHQWTD
jgi:hypothetical protein